MTHPLVLAVRQGLEKAADASKAPQMQAYMKSDMPFRGVAAAEQRRLWRQIFPSHPLSSAREWQTAALALWRDAAFREERYAAIALTDLRGYATFRTSAAMPMFEEMIVTGAWWDYVDALATHQVGDLLRGDARRMKPLMRRWSRDANMWKRRASILCQIRCKKETDLDLLYACIEPNLTHKDFFIRKAIGWALRQYAWVNPAEVRRYVRSNRDRLSGLSVREATRNIA